MKTPNSKSSPKSSLIRFQNSEIKNGRLIHIEGGNSDAPSNDGVIGVEEIIGA